MNKFCAKDAAVISEEQSRSEAFLAAPYDGNALSADVRDAVLPFAIQNGD